MAVVARGRTVWLIALSICAGLLIGVWRGSLELNYRDEYRPYLGQTVLVEGSVQEDVSLGEQGDLRLYLHHVRIDGTVQHGNIWVNTVSRLDIRRGDVLTVQGVLNTGFGGVAASMYRAQLLTASRPYPGDVARRVRDWFASGVRTAVKDPEASLGIGYLTGQRSSLPESLDEELRILGLTHVVVASGYNLTILVRLARRVVARISKYLAACVALALVIGFMAVTGLSPSMSRAGLVAMLSLAAWYYGRSTHPVVLLLVSAAITVLWKPAYAWGDIGWYLSFGSFIGVLLVSPLLQHYFWGVAKKPGVLRQIVVDTLSAQLLTLPIIIFVFGSYSPLALPANLLILPLVPLAMLLTFIAGVGSLLVPTLAVCWGLPAQLILQYMTTITHWLGELPGARGETTLTIIGLVMSYVGLGGMILLLQRATRHDFRDNAAENN